MKAKPQMFYGFWKYSGHFQNVLGGKIHSPCSRKDYPGAGYWAWDSTGCFVKPFLITNLEDGLEMQQQLDSIAENHRRDAKKLDLHYAAEQAKIIKVPK